MLCANLGSKYKVHVIVNVLESFLQIGVFDMIFSFIFVSNSFPLYCKYHNPLYTVYRLVALAVKNTP